MGNIQANQASNPLYKQVVNSKPVKLATDNPVLAAAGLVCSGAVMAEAPRSTDLVVTSLKKGAIPFLATGVAVLGASMVRNAIQNDWNNAGENFESTVKFGVAAAGGSALTVIGVEIASKSLTEFSPIGKAAELIGRAVPYKMVGKNPLLLGSLTAVAVAGAGYYMYSKSENTKPETKAEQK